jgi:hypothetical protein
MTHEEIMQNSVSLIAFARTNGKLSIAPCETVDEETRETQHFKSLVFTHPTKKQMGEDGKPKLGKDNQPLPLRVFVSFSKKLGELTGKQIVDLKDKLFVLKRDNGKFTLWQEGQGGWEDVDLGI